jgi:hypothetical protein
MVYRFMLSRVDLQEVRFAGDSPLEQSGFELVVPPPNQHRR